MLSAYYSLTSLSLQDRTLVFVKNISVLSTCVKVAKVLVMNKHQESVTDTKILKAEDSLSTRIKAIGSYFFKLCGELGKTISK